MFHTLQHMSEMTNTEIVSKVMANPQDVFISTTMIKGQKAVTIVGTFCRKTEKMVRALNQNLLINPAICYIGEALECIITPNSEEISVEEEVMKTLSLM